MRSTRTGSCTRWGPAATTTALGRRSPLNSAPAGSGVSGTRCGERGFTLFEVLISILLTAVMVSSIFSVALTAKTSGGAGQRKLVASLAMRQLSGQLQNFVTSYWCYAAAPPTCPAANTWAATGTTDIAGPMSTTPGAASWYWSTVGVTDSCGGACYALAVGTHKLSNYLPGWFEAAPYNAQIQYTVAAGASYGTAGTSPTTSISVNWTEP